MKIEKTPQAISQNLPERKSVKNTVPTRKNERTALSGENTLLSGKAVKALKAGKTASRKKTSDLKPLPEKNWTVLLYLDGDNNLEPDITKNLLDLEQVGSTSDINFVAQLDRGELKDKITRKIVDHKEVKWEKKPYPSPHGGLKESNRYYVEKSRDSQHLSSPVVEKLGKSDSGSDKTLQEFLTWGFEKYPAKNYLVILSNHGGGYRGGWSDDGFMSRMPLPEMNQAILGAEKAAGVDKDDVILGFDACLMAQAEAGYGLKETARSMIASEEVENNGGWAFSAIFGKKKEVGQYDREQMENKIIDGVKWNTKNLFTLSVTDLTRMDDLKDSVNGMAEALLASPAPKDVLRDTIKSAQGYDQHGDPHSPTTRFYGNYRDLYDVADKLVKNRKIKDPGLKQAARQVRQEVKLAVKNETHVINSLMADEDEKPGHPQLVGNFAGSHGLSINTNDDPALKRDYDKSDFVKDTRWYEALQHLRVRIPQTPGPKGNE